MRTEKFDSTKDNWDTDDIGYALERNPQDLVTKEDIDVIVAEVCGENDGANWYWVVKRKSDKKYIYVSGGCDYSGWDCQSLASSSGPYDTAKDAAIQAPEKEDDYDRFPRQALLRQLTGTLPFATYAAPLT